MLVFAVMRGVVFHRRIVLSLRHVLLSEARILWALVIRHSLRHTRISGASWDHGNMVIVGVTIDNDAVTIRRSVLRILLIIVCTIVMALLLLEVRILRLRLRLLHQLHPIIILRRISIRTMARMMCLWV